MDRKSLIQRSTRFTNLEKRLLLLMVDHEGPDGIVTMRQKDIAEALGVHQSSLSRVIRCRLSVGFADEVVIRTERTDHGKRYRLVGELSPNGGDHGRIHSRR